jgi:hypothetical protein
MKSIFNTKISFYSNVTDKVGMIISLNDFLFCDKYRPQIEKIRSTEDAEAQKYMKKQLPLATISGIFAPSRRADNLICHSHLLCIDIDKKDNLNVDWFDDLSSEWHNIPQILYAAHSVGGKGWFAIFRIAYPEKHQGQFEALRHDFAQEGLIIDRSCRDVSRMRIMSYDNNPYINENATIYNKIWIEPKSSYIYRHSGDDDIKYIEKCCQEITTRGIDITATYDDWFYVGAALASLGERGRSIFHMVSSQNPKYNIIDTDKKFNNCLQYVNNISIGTFFHICFKYGINWK